MKRTLVALTASLAVFVGGAATAAGASTTAKSDSSKEETVAGVVTKVDTGKHMLTVVAPSGTEVDITHIGKTVFIDRGIDLVSVQASVEKSVKVWRDDKEASLSSLKEGDVVRASFDPSNSSFASVRAVSQDQIDKDASQAQAQLKHELDASTSAASARPSAWRSAAASRSSCAPAAARRADSARVARRRSAPGKREIAPAVPQGG